MDNSDINEIIKNAASALDLTNFKGDIVMYKHVDKEMNIADGGIGEQHVHYHNKSQNEKSENITSDNEEIPLANEVAHDRNQTGHTESEELCHFLYPGIDEEQGLSIHQQIKDLVSRFAMKDICNFLKVLAEEKKILLPQIPQNAFDELHRMGMPPEETKGFGYDNFCKYYRK